MTSQIFTFTDKDDIADGKNDLAVCIHRVEQRGSKFGAITVEFGHVVRENGEFTHLSGYYTYNNEHVIGGLEMSCQYNTRDSDMIRVPYAFQVQYNKYGIPFGIGNIDENILRLKMLKKIRSRLDKFTDEFGYLPANDFGKFVRALMALMGIKHAYKADRVTEIGDVEYYVNMLISEENPF